MRAIRVPWKLTRGTRVRMHPAVALRKMKPACAASPESGGFGPGGTTGGGGGGGGCGRGGGGRGGSDGQNSFVSIVTVSLTDMPAVVPVTIAVFSTTAGRHSAGALVLCEQA